MTGLRITRARGWEAERIALILRAAVADAAWLPSVRTPREERQLLLAMIRRGDVFVARKARRIVGFLALDRAGEVHGLYVLPDQRGTGVALALMDHAKRDRDRLGLFAHAQNLRARRFYHREGFRPMSLGAGNDEKLTEIRYEWERRP